MDQVPTKYRSGNGLTKDTSEMACAPDLSIKCFDKAPKREGEAVQVSLIFSTCTHLGHKGRSMELRGDFQEFLCLGLEPIQG